MSSVKLSETIVFHFGTASNATGAATDADSLPVVTIEDNGVAMGYVPPVVKVATGLYRCTIAATTGNGFTAGHRYSCYVAVTVGGVDGRDGVAEFQLTTLSGNELGLDVYQVLQFLKNKLITDPGTGIATLYDDAGVALLTANLFEDAAGSQAYRGQGAERRERFA